MFEEVNLDEWERFAELAAETGIRPVLHSLKPEEAEPPSLEMVVDELASQGFLGYFRAVELYHLHFLDQYSTDRDFLRELNKVGKGRLFQA